MHCGRFRPVKSNGSSEKAMNPEDKSHEEKQHNNGVDSVCVWGGFNDDVCSLTASHTHTSTPPVKSREVKKVTEDDISLSCLVVLLEGNSVNPEHMKMKTSHQKSRKYYHEQKLAVWAYIKGYDT